MLDYTRCAYTSSKYYVANKQGLSNFIYILFFLGQNFSVVLIRLLML